MYLSKNKIFQFIFFLLITKFAIFNGGNSNLQIQINFIILCTFFLVCTLNKNYIANLKFFLNSNKISILFFILFLIYLIFQFSPIPVGILKYLSPEKYKILLNLPNDASLNTISFHPSDTYFQMINFLSLFLIVLVMKMIFQNNRHKRRLYIYVSFLGACFSLIAVLFYLSGNPDFFIIKNSTDLSSATGFFVNRTVFSVFLLFCLIGSFELLKLKNEKESNSLFFLKIYIRLFVIIISIGIITSFSRIGNFLFICTIIYFLVNCIFVDKEKNKSFINLLIIFIIFDVIILGYYFGFTHLIERFYFLKDELTISNEEFIRINIIEFGFKQLKDFVLFGYGAGSFEIIFQLKYENLTNLYADHSHSDLIEFLGEFGLIGFIFISIPLLHFFFNKENITHTSIILIFYSLIILMFDFSLHIPIIQIFFIIFFILNKKIYS